jgi:hypothetical protein
MSATPVWWLGVEMLQEPHNLGAPDEAGRTVFVFNVVVTKRPSVTFTEEILAILGAASVGTIGEDLWGGGSAIEVPALDEEGGAGPRLEITETSGAGPLGTHNGGRGAYRNPSAQILVRASSPTAAKAMAHAAYNALVAVSNRYVTPWEAA